MQAYEGRRSSLARASSVLGLAGNGPRVEAARTRIIAMVDAATDPSQTEAEATSRRTELIAMANGGGPSRSAARAAITYAIRKRLKTDNADTVINTIKLLSGLMRTCPYYYRNIADDKMFRRLWRFVVPDYKNSVRSMIPFGRKGGADADSRNPVGDPEIAVRILVLIRAWAEELSVMFNGKIDPSAGFLIERYSNKSTRIPFPDVPRSSLPWVCPVGPNATQKASVVYTGRKEPETSFTGRGRSRSVL